MKEAVEPVAGVPCSPLSLLPGVLGLQGSFFPQSSQLLEGSEDVV